MIDDILINKISKTKNPRLIKLAWGGISEYRFMAHKSSGFLRKYYNTRANQFEDKLREALKGEK